MSRKIPYMIILAACLIIGCRKLKDPDANYTYQMPDAGTDGFSVSSLSAEGMDENLISEATNLIIREHYKRIDGFLIFRNNKLVYENYFHGYSEDILHNVYSVGKSITSVLAGIAIDKGFIDSLNTPIKKYLPEYASSFSSDARKDSITINHLLNMNACLDCDDWIKHTEEQMQKSKDWVKFTLDLPMVKAPGSQGNYCTGYPVTLGRIIENQSKMTIEQFANHYLFKPLNVTQYKWHIMPDGKQSGGGLLFLRPRDMAKIGLLMLNKGTYNGQQLVSQQWVQRSSQNEIKLLEFDGYGYLWWKQKFSNGIEAYFADGNGGQQLFVIPSKDLVVVFTGANKNTSIGLQNFQIVNNYILPSLQ